MRLLSKQAQASCLGINRYVACVCFLPALCTTHLERPEHRHLLPHAHAVALATELIAIA